MAIITKNVDIIRGGPATIISLSGEEIAAGENLKLTHIASIENMIDHEVISVYEKTGDGTLKVYIEYFTGINVSNFIIRSELVSGQKQDIVGPYFRILLEESGKTQSVIVNGVIKIS
ncbi:MAG: hypothetical protein WCY30_00215 [Candidatus Neomarinimicrobiota bacterium]|jgi:hypothetical protein